MPHTLNRTLSRISIDDQPSWTIVLKNVLFSADSRNSAKAPRAIITQGELEHLFLELIMDFDFGVLKSKFDRMYNGAYIKRIFVYNILRRLIEIEPEIGKPKDIKDLVNKLEIELGLESRGPTDLDGRTRPLDNEPN